MNEEEKQAVDILKNSIADYVIGEYCDKCADNKICNYRNEDCYFIQAIDKVLNLIEKQQKEIEFYKIQELGYIQGYEDGKSHKQTAVAIRNENASQMFIQKKIEELEKEKRILIEKYTEVVYECGKRNEEIEKLKSKKYILNAETKEIKEIPISDDYISKDKIKEIREKYKKERANMTQIIFSKYGKTQQTFNQAVVNEVIKVIDELLGE